jgi:hypothetical protein
MDSNSQRMRYRNRGGLNSNARTENTPHEDYLVCHLCEQFFSSIEKDVASTFHRSFKKGEKLGHAVLPSQQLFTFGLSCDPAIFLLFIYSIMWRAQQTYCPQFWLVNMNHEEVEQLREVLHGCMSTKPSEMIACFNQHYRHKLPFTYQVVIPTGQLRGDDIVIMGLPGEQGHYGIFAGEFFLGIVKHPGDTHAVNDGVRSLEIDAIPIEEWRSFYQPHLDAASELNK